MKIKCSVSTDKVGSEITDTIEIDDALLEGKTEEEIEELCEAEYQEWMWDNIEGYWEKEETS